MYNVGQRICSARTWVCPLLTFTAGSEASLGVTFQELSVRNIGGNCERATILYLKGELPISDKKLINLLFYISKWLFMRL